MPYGYISDDVSFTFLLTGDYYIKDVFDKWIESVFDIKNKTLSYKDDYVSEVEIDKVNNFLRNQAEPDYVDEILNFADEKEINEKNKDNSDTDELYDEALEIIKSERKASTSFLQRKLQIGYNRAARIIDQMELNGEVSKANHVGKREVLK